MNYDINFPNLHISLSHVGQSVTIFGYEIAYYGIVIAIGMVLGVLVILHRAKKMGISDDDMLDICIFSLLLGVVGARLYYVAFQWDYYKDNLLAIFNIRQGGLAIYGGVLLGMLTCFLLCKRKKISFLHAADAIMPGVLLGQAIGRWGNFFNREVFGQYTDNLFAMELPVNAVRSLDDITTEMIENSRMVGDVMYVQVHPTFLYESMWNFALFIFLLIYTKHRKFDGEILLIYLFGYGIGRFWIEGLRTDQLFLWNTNIPVSQALALCMVILSVVIYIIKMVRLKKADVR